MSNKRELGRLVENKNFIYKWGYKFTHGLSDYMQIAILMCLAVLSFAIIVIFLSSVFG